VYAVMTHAGLACLLAGMLLLGAWTGSPRFEDWRAAAPALSGTARNAAFALLALGFAGKAGVIPLHVWLPLAHPAAPSHVSALMSGVMIKLGVYGLLRVSLDWLGVGPAWWGVAILVAGAASSVIGVLYALVEHDLKRLLAFHSIENIGIILLGLGSAVLYHGAGLPAPAPRRGGSESRLYPRDRESRADRRPRDGVLREGVRHHVPRPPPERCGRPRPRSARDDASGDGGTRGRLRRPWTRSDPRHSRARRRRRFRSRDRAARHGRRLADAARVGRLRESLHARDRRRARCVAPRPARRPAARAGVAPDARLRDVGMRPHRADRADGV